ncbi:hypothetical protein [Actinomadura gamaensis]|uniref:Secreted protein n=1 Tax=Actinomadura gamaensis TaxID=1763541 RepID=A0ABV9U8C0_9ACTN
MARTQAALLPADEDGIRLPVRDTATRYARYDPRGWPTPDRVRFLAVLVAVLAVLFAALAARRASGGEAGFREIGREAGPQVVASSDLYLALNDMDAQLANVLLIGDGKGLSVTRDQALGTFEQRRAQADRDLQQASALAGRDGDAALGLRRALDGLGRYESLAAQAILLDGQHPHPAARPPAAALALYRQATQAMRSDVLPAAEKLRDANAERIETSYKHRRSALAGGAEETLALGLATVAVLAGLQLYLVRRTRRSAQPALLAATAVALVTAVIAAATLDSAAGHLRVAKKDAFDSVLALTRARAIGWETNADESRGIVDPGQWKAYQDDFYLRAGQLAEVFGSEPLAGTEPLSYEDALAGIVRRYQGMDTLSERRIRLGGLLGAEFANITFPGERDAAEKALYAWQAYQADDVGLRAMYASGDLQKTVQFDTSPAPADSNGAFNAFDQAMARVIAINQAQFEAHVRRGGDDLAGWTAVPPLAALVIIGLVWLGVRPRLSEYR